jgi:hypothetical protein
MPRASSVTQISHCLVRGRRNALVRNMRSSCITTAAMKTSAAQWCTWRMSSPPRTSRLSRMVESKALLTKSPRSGP